MGSIFITKFSLPSFLKQVDKLEESQRESIRRAGFGNLLHIPDHVLRRSQLNQLMETWNSEKQAFVFPPGEIKITLLDVSLILGLRVIGEPVVLLEDLPLSNLEKDFGASLSKRTISLNSLKQKLDSLGKRHDEYFVRVFLLYCFGTLLFPSANGKVDSRFLHLLENVDRVSSFAWGAAVLGDLHKHLSQRKSKKTNDVGGCLILLQIWCYEHIVIGRPKLLNSTFPRACRWESSSKRYITSPIKFEELEHTQIIWKLQPTSMESLVDIIEEIPKEWYIGTGPGTSDQPIEVKSTIRRVRVNREELTWQWQPESVIFLLSDDEESQEAGNLQDKEELRRVQGLEAEHIELRKQHQYDKDTIKMLQEENIELRKQYQYEKDTNRMLQEENIELRKQSSYEKDTIKMLQEENIESRKKSPDEKDTIKMLQEENIESRKKSPDEKDTIKMLQEENIESRKKSPDEKDTIKMLQEENEELKNSVEKLRALFSNLDQGLSNVCRKLINGLTR